MDIVTEGKGKTMVKNLCEFCAHRKMCFCGDQNIPTEECRYYDPCVVRCRDCIGKSTWYNDAEYGCAVCGMSGMYLKSEDSYCSYGIRKDGDRNG